MRIFPLKPIGQIKIDLGKMCIGESLATPLPRLLGLDLMVGSSSGFILLQLYWWGNQKRVPMVGLYLFQNHLDLEKTR